MKLSDEVIDAQAGAVKRASPMLRSAKVVCLTGEYVCLVRDVSDTGVLLSYLHEVPGEARIILVLGNGQTYPIQRLWEGESQASYRFASAISVPEFLHERSPFALRPVRLSVAASARLVDGADAHAAQLVDLSTHGAKIDCAARLACDRRISFQAHGMAPRPATIIWSETTGNAARCGLQFSEPLTLRELAQASLRMQPLRAPPAAPAAILGQTTQATSAA